MFQDVEKILFDEAVLAKRIGELGEEISKDFANEEVMLVGILKGASVFMSDLIRKISIPAYIDYMVVSSYGNSAETSGVVRIIKDLEDNIEGKNIIIVEDIIDTGLTLAYLKKNLLNRNPKSLKICTLLDKPSRRQKEIAIDYKGFEVPDEFIIGYGIDYAEKYRNLPFVGVLKREVYEK
ncbi:hypoxanthine phosphoribosyltransferase [Herbinix luporum]|uniref:Hypoxanthine phosphoribosyltransferase n=1 Tax=Herbinix luporum TaxID=1679721 RepID=A0A0K8J3K8_9FIRM|nr:hypoxanthine phosphoribosyltransferase [Herbinix luporum]CUH92077.1 Hypoxanthine-guanine phosphoribosyltransferase [Herbinix luporum]